MTTENLRAMCIRLFNNGRSLEQIAAATGMTVPAVHTVLSKAGLL